MTSEGHSPHVVHTYTHTHNRYNKEIGGENSPDVITKRGSRRRETLKLDLKIYLLHEFIDPAWFSHYYLLRNTIVSSNSALYFGP